MSSDILSAAARYAGFKRPISSAPNSLLDFLIGTSKPKRSPLDDFMPPIASLTPVRTAVADLLGLPHSFLQGPKEFL